MDSRTSKSKEQERHGAKGLLDDRTPAQLLIQGIDVSDGSKYTCKDLFGDLTGASLMDAIWEKFGVGEQDVEWFYKTDGGEQARTIMRSPLSRQIQESTCSEYMQRLYREGLSQLASGDAVFRFRDSSHSPPYEAGSFNHRAESFYRCYSEAPDHDMVQKVLKKGLTK
ncbi:unnamed protein product, partial [Durusdinium trenchii]